MGKQSRRRRAGRGSDGPDFAFPTPGEVRNAFDQFDMSAGWPVIARSVLPLFPRHTPSTVRAGAPIQAFLPPGIPVSFGIDIGPAFVTMTRELADGWGVDTGDVVKTALDNVRALAAELPPALVGDVRLEDGLRVRMLRSRAGWSSTLLLLPDLLPRFFGPGPHLMGAPCRDVLFAFPPTMDPDHAAAMVEAISWADPAGIAVAGYLHHAGVLEPVVPAAPGSALGGAGIGSLAAGPARVV